MELIDISDIKNRLADFDPSELRERIDELSSAAVIANAAYKRKLASKSLQYKFSETPPVSDKIAEMKAYVDPEVEVLEVEKIKTQGNLRSAERELDEYNKLHDRDKKLAEIDKALMMKFREND